MLCTENKISYILFYILHNNLVKSSVSYAPLNKKDHKGERKNVREMGIEKEKELMNLT